jgi:hypothetical protein
VLELIVEAHPVHALEHLVLVGVDPDRTTAADADRKAGIVVGHHAGSMMGRGQAVTWVSPCWPGEARPPTT